MDRNNARHVLTRISLAIVFIGIGIWEILQPSHWSSYIPNFLTFIAGAITLTMAHGVVLVIIGLAVLLGVYLRIAAALAVLMMIFIIISLLLSLGFTSIAIRDIAILLIAGALFFDDTEYLRLKK